VLAARRQTGGQYVAGVKLARNDDDSPDLKSVFAWWFGFNPLLFSWPMAIVAGLPLAALVALISSTFALFLTALVVLLCVAAPIAAFVSALIDQRNRALHDRVANVVVVRVSDP
jgi:hypothetical protein